MNYAEILSRRLKKAGRDFAKGQAVDKKEQLQVILREIMQEGQDTGTFFPWTEAVRRLNLGTLCGGGKHLCGKFSKTLYGNL